MEELFLCMLSSQVMLSELIVKIKNELFGMYVNVNAYKSTSSETHGLLVETMRYFRAKVYFKC